MTDTKALDHRDEMTRLEILQTYKRHLARRKGVNLSPFACDRVIRYGCDVQPYDVPDIHRGVRQRITQLVRDIQAGHSSKVVILAGDPGMGKSHLINHFRSPARADELGYILICNSNHWKANEFEPCLLDWILEALVRPHPDDESHLLLRKVRDLAFAGLEQILARPGQLGHFLHRAGIWGRLRRRLRPEHARFQQLAKERNAAVFKELDFPRFARHVCNNFLDSGSNLFHRYVLSVLLRYLFEDEREAVLHWLRGREVSSVDFGKVIGVKEEMDCKHKIAEAVKILVSLFTPEVSGKLRPDGDGGRLFFFAFDQMEGRQELFEDERDWFKFFGHVSELVNCLPNVFILFTMTTALRIKLFPQMERQFQDRIIRDTRFQLDRIDDTEVLALYSTRVDRWLGDDLPEVRDQLAALNQPYLPFTQAEVLDLSLGKTLREMLEVFDDEFIDRLMKLPIEPRLDYLVSLNALREEEQSAKPFDYTANHLDRVRQLLECAREVIASRFGLVLSPVEWRSTDDPRLPALCLEFRDPNLPARRVRVFLARLPFFFNQFLDGCAHLLHRLRDQKFLWLVRPERIDKEVEDRRPGQVFARVLETDHHARAQAMIGLLGRRQDYSPADQTQADTVICEELNLTYLGEMLRQVREALQQAPGSPEEEGGQEPVASALGEGAVL